MRMISRNLTALLSIALLGGCGTSQSDYSQLNSPHPDVRLKFATSDLGACCSTKFFLAGEVFEEDISDLAVITGSMDIRYQWVAPLTLKIEACDARKIEHRSSFSNRDYTERFILIVQNVMPSDQGNGSDCKSAMSEDHAQLWPADAS